MRIAVGILIAFLLGAFCRWLRVPVPAPSTFLGALLVMSITLGYLTADYWFDRSTATPPADPHTTDPGT